MTRYERTPYSDYPEKVTVVIPTEEVELPTPLPWTLPRETTHIEHTVYFKSGPNGAENYWISQRPQQQVNRDDETSLASYLEELGRLGIPKPPEESEWRPNGGLWLPNKTLAAVEVYPGENPQGRVTQVGTRTTPPVIPGRTFEKVATGNAFVDRLTALGFPPGSFDELREDSRFLEGMTDPLSRILMSRPLRPLTKAVDKLLEPMAGVNLRVIPQWQFISSVRSPLELR